MDKEARFWNLVVLLLVVAVAVACVALCYYGLM